MSKVLATMEVNGSRVLVHRGGRDIHVSVTYKGEIYDAEIGSYGFFCYSMNALNNLPGPLLIAIDDCWSATNNPEKVMSALRGLSESPL